MSTKPQAQREKVTAQSNREPKDPTEFTIKAWEKVNQELSSDDRQDFIDASDGFMATLTADGQVTKLPVVEVKIMSDNPDIKVPIWNLGEYAFLKNGSAPYSVNPSLWRQAQLNVNNGLFGVTTRTYSLNGATLVREIFQVRGFDISNMTIVETDNGIIVIDPLISTETARAALNLYYDGREESDRPPVVAVIFTHSHVDHYGGVKGVVTDEEVRSGKVKIYAPAGFLEHAVSENVYAGSAMYRRSIYMYGTLLPRGVQTQVDSGLGKTTSVGESGLFSAKEITANETVDIDGVKVTFHLAQDSEAPSEMLIYFPQFKALCAAEDMTHNLHNLYSLRGAQVRNAAAWWKIINNVITLFEKETEVIFAQHHWPIRNEPPGKILNFLKKQRDLYKYIHDQSLRLLNQGRTMIELSEMISLPTSLSDEWFNRDYYGTVNHDSKAVYQRYLGWYDANPANLHPLPPVEASKKYVEYMGGAQAVLDRAKLAFAAGEYRWVAEVMNHVIFARDSSDPIPPDPLTLEAKLLQADTLEQLGYQAESGPWRNAYLAGARELRLGVSPALKAKPLSIDIMSAMSLDQYFDYMGLRFNAPLATDDENFVPLTTINWMVKNSHTGRATEYYALELVDYTLPYTAYEEARFLPSADVTLTMERTVLDDISTAPDMTVAFNQAVADGKIFVQGDSKRVTAIFDKLDLFPADFDIVTPRKEVVTA